MFGSELGDGRCKTHSLTQDPFTHTRYPLLTSPLTTSQTQDSPPNPTPSERPTAMGSVHSPGLNEQGTHRCAHPVLRL